MLNFAVNILFCLVKATSSAFASCPNPSICFLNHFFGICTRRQELLPGEGYAGLGMSSSIQYFVFSPAFPLKYPSYFASIYENLMKMALDRSMRRRAPGGRGPGHST